MVKGPEGKMGVEQLRPLGLPWEKQQRWWSLLGLGYKELISQLEGKHTAQNHIPVLESCS